jgi:hypothetical protein
MDHETWLIEEGDEIIQKKASQGAISLSPWERLVYCFWVADYGMKNAGDLATSFDLYSDFLSEGRSCAEALEFVRTKELFSLSPELFAKEYRDRFDSVCAEIRKIGPIAKRSSWKTSPLPERCETLGFTAVFTDAEADTICRGLIPKEMEDKWFVFYEQGWLYFHRSWTGGCVYWVKLDGCPVGVRVIESWVNRNPEQYTETDTEHDRKLLGWLINVLLLGKRTDFPKKTQ